MTDKASPLVRLCAKKKKKFGSDLPAGQFLVEPKTSESFALRIDGETIRLKRRQAG